MFTKQIRSPLSPEVLDIIRTVEAPTTIKPYTTNIKEWLSPIIDLSGFFVYPTNGITEGLNWFMSTTDKNIVREKGDYEWVDNISNRNEPSYRYISCPSSKDGNYREIPTDVAVALDIAYVGTTLPRKIPMTDNIDYVFYSLSKPFGVNGIRTGWLFTRHKEKKLHRLIYGANYYNHYANAIAEAIIGNFTIDYVYKKYYNKQQEICNQFDLCPSDSVWLATSLSDRYRDFIRADIARLCLTSLIDENLQ